MDSKRDRSHYTLVVSTGVSLSLIIPAAGLAVLGVDATYNITEILL